jgi:sugar lactone lactonase YvrE
MKSNRLSVGVVLVFVAALTAGLARSGVVPSAGRTLADVPTTIATLPNDSEGLAVDPKTGTIYAAEAPNAVGDCIVRSVTLDGNLSLVGYVPMPASGACAPRGLEFRGGQLYISDQGTGSTGWVYEMNPATGFVTTFASGVAGANGIAFDSSGNLWITDGLRGLGRVYRRDAHTGAVQEVFRVPPIANGTTYGGRLSSPSAAGVGRFIAIVPSVQAEVKAVANGIAFVDRNDGAIVIGQGRFSTLYVADTTRGAIWAVLIDARGNLAPGQTGCDSTLQDNTLCDDAIFVSHPRLEGADGIWADTERSLWVAANARQAIIHVDRHGNVTEVFRNPVNLQLLRSSADTPEGDRHLLEYPTSPIIVPVKGSPFLTRLCVASTDRPGRDNAPGTVGEIGGPGQDKGKISCF